MADAAEVVTEHYAGEPIAVTLARLEGMISTNFAIIRGDIKAQGDAVDDHETRIRTLERETPTRKELQALQAAITDLNHWRWRLIGFFSAISVVVGVITAVVTSFIQNVSFH